MSSNTTTNSAKQLPHSQESPPPPPPPPYSHFARSDSTVNASGARPGGLLSPPDSSRVLERDHEMTATTPARPRQLPSLKDLMNAEQPITYPAPVAPVPEPVQQSFHPRPVERERRRSISPRMAQSARSLPHSRPHSPRQNAASQHEVPYSHAQRPAPLAPTCDPRPHYRSSPPHQPSKLPTLQPQMNRHSPVEPARRSLGGYEHRPLNRPRHLSNAYPPHAEVSYPPENASHLATAPPPASAYPPSSTYPSELRHRQPSRSDAPAYPLDLRNGRHGYGESVKRHLDIFDLETSLNDVTESSSHMLEFSRHYSQLAHQAQKSGGLPRNLPSFEEIDELMRQNAVARQSLLLLREVVYTTQQVVVAESAVEQPPQLAQEAQARAEEEAQYHEDAKDGMTQGDPKRRRGRAALPGRCHSCNRLETPEWRRGPDGARTLCNACGLHWAKLKRKQEAGKAPPSNADLRPKTAVGAS